MMFRSRHGQSPGRNRANRRIKKIFQYRSIRSRVNFLPIDLHLDTPLVNFRYYQIRAGVKFAPRIQPTTKVDLKSELIPSSGIRTLEYHSIGFFVFC